MSTTPFLDHIKAGYTFKGERNSDWLSHAQQRSCKRH